MLAVQIRSILYAEFGFPSKYCLIKYDISNMKFTDNTPMNTLLRLSLPVLFISTKNNMITLISTQNNITDELINCALLMLLLLWVAMCAFMGRLHLFATAPSSSLFHKKSLS